MIQQKKSDTTSRKVIQQLRNNTTVREVIQKSTTWAITTEESTRITTIDEVTGTIINKMRGHHS